MCTVLVINKGEKEIETPSQFKEHFGFLPLIDEHYNDLVMDGCLCQCDLEKTLEQKGIKYENDFGDIYVNDNF